MEYPKSPFFSIFSFINNGDMTELDNLQAKDFIEYIKKHKISKSDVIKLSEYYKIM